MKKLLSLKTLYILLTAFIAILVGIVGGVVDIMQTPGVIKASEHLGYPLYFFTLLGIFKILGGIALFIPCNKIKNIAYAGFTFDFIFASFSHFSVGDPFAKILTPLIMLVILALSYTLKQRTSK